MFRARTKENLRIWASSRENVSSGVSDQVRLKLAPQLQEQKLETLHYLGSEQQMRWSDCADAHICCSHMT